MHVFQTERNAILFLNKIILFGLSRSVFSIQDLKVQIIVWNCIDKTRSNLRRQKYIHFVITHLIQHYKQKETKSDRTFRRKKNSKTILYTSQLYSNSKNNNNYNNRTKKTNVNRQQNDKKKIHNFYDLCVIYVCDCDGYKFAFKILYLIDK